MLIMTLDLSRDTRYSSLSHLVKTSSISISIRINLDLLEFNRFPMDR